VCHDRLRQGLNMSYLGNVRASDSIIRSMTAALWTAGNYELSSGEFGIESDTGKQKVGVGKRWADTEYLPMGNGLTANVFIYDNNGEHAITIVNGLITSWSAP